MVPAFSDRLDEIGHDQGEHPKKYDRQWKGIELYEVKTKEQTDQPNCNQPNDEITHDMTLLPPSLPLSYDAC